MKKLLAAALSLALLALNASAAEGSQDLDPPLWRQQGAYSYEDYLAWENLTEEDYGREEARWLAAGADTYYDPDVAAWLAAHPEEAAAFDADAWFRENWPGEDKDEYLFYQLWSGDEHDFFVEMRYDWVLDQLSAEGGDADQPEKTPPEDPQARIDRWVRAMGGAPGRLNLMVNGAYLASSPGMEPYAEDGVTYLPASQLSQLLGVPVAESRADGYVPLRLNAEAAGWKVLWDQDYDSAVLLDPDALADRIDQSFATLNTLSVPASPQLRTGTLRLSLPAADGAAREVPVSYRLTSGAEGWQARVEADLSFLASTPEEAEALGSAVLEFRQDYARETLHLNAPALLPLLDADGVDPSAWLRVERSGGGTTLGRQLAGLWMEYFSEDSFEMGMTNAYQYVPLGRERPVTAWQAMCVWAEDCSRLFGEDALDRGGVSLDRYDFFNVLWDARLTNSGNLREDIGPLLHDFRLQAERDGQGGLDGEFRLLLDSAQAQPDNSYWRSRDLYLDLTSRFSGPDQENALTLRYQGLSVTWQETCAAAADGPAVAPPAGAQVLDAPDTGW